MNANGSRFDSSGLTNDDFRKLLATSQSHAAQNENIKKKTRNKGEQEYRHSKLGPESFGHEEKGVSANHGHVYRDRAEERRRGMVRGEAIDDMNASHCIIPERNLSAVSLEESKYLGGDIEHTHLVKGLDYALLSQIRAEREKKKLILQEEKRVNEGRAAAVQDITGDGHLNARFEGPTSGRIGRAVITALRQLVHRDNNHDHASKNVAIRRTGFLYNMKEDDSKFEIPIIRKRAEDFQTETDEAQNCGLPHHVIEEIASIMEYTMGTSRNKKNGKPIERTASFGLITQDHGVLHRLEETDQTKPVDEDEDIFADAGTDYAPERRSKPEGGILEPTYEMRAKYFDTKDLLGEKPHSEILQDTLILGMDSGNVTAARDELLNKQEKKARMDRLASLHAGDNDGYEECYPGFVGNAGVLEDSDDDDLEPEKDQNGVQKKRQSALENAKEKSKLESQLHNIQKIFEEKGYEHTTAFTSSEVGTRKSGVRDNLPSSEMAQAIKKKRRI